MARLARGQYLDPQTVQIVHVTSRCVRRAFLCGNDPLTGKSFEHRRQWVRQRLEFLASVFAIDCLTFAVMNNHIHLILRSRPDIVRGWSDEEIARRWFRLCPPRGKDGKPVEPSDYDIEMLASNPRKLAELRVRLSDISWWMRMTAEKIARQANREDRCKGRFWEGRYKAQLLLDEASLLACAIYVDLNPIRAAISESLEDSHFTGAKERIDDLKDSVSAKQRRDSDNEDALVQTIKKRKQTKRWERSQKRKRSGWLSPIEINQTSKTKPQVAKSYKRRASGNGFLPVTLVRYLELLDWTGRQLRKDKRGVICSDVPPILNRLGISGKSFSTLISNFGKLFKRAVGQSESIATEAVRRKQKWMQAPGAKFFG